MPIFSSVNREKKVEAMKKIRIIGLSWMIFSAAVLAGAEKADYIKSLILPGWGQQDLNMRHSRVLMTADIALLSSLFGMTWYADKQQNDLFNYASEYARADQLYDNEQYWRDLGDYMSWDQHRTAMLENRTPEKIYSEAYAWSWLTLNNANTYRNLRRSRDFARNRKTMILGALAFNRMVSFIDLMYLDKLSQNVSMSYMESAGVSGLSLNITLR